MPRAVRTPLATFSSVDLNTPDPTRRHELVRIGYRTNENESSPNFGKEQPIRQRCAVCHRVHGSPNFTMYKCKQCDLFLCADGHYSRSKEGRKHRTCFSYHVHHVLPAGRCKRRKVVA